MRFDVIILGGGIVGCTLGFFLARRGLKPLILEPHGIAAGTTGASFAWANASSKTTDAAYHGLNAAGVMEYHALLAEFGPDTGIAATGAVQVVDPADSAGMAALDHDEQALQRFGYRVHRLDRPQIAALEPDLALPDNATALHYPDDLAVDAPRFTRVMAGEMRRAGGQIRPARAVALIADDDGIVHGVETDDGPIHAAHVVTALGKDTPGVLARITGFAAFATRFPLRRVPGFLLTTPGGALRPRHVVFTSTTDEMHVLPVARGGIRIGSDDVDGIVWNDRSETALRSAGRALLARAERLLPGLSARTDLADCRLQVGIRAVPEDGHSLVGPLPGATGLTLIATHSGITLAPVLGALVTDWIETGQRPAALAPFGLDRFPGFMS